MIFPLPEVQEVLRRDKRRAVMPDISVLRNQQQEVYEKLYQYAIGDRAVGAMLLSAPAGTGKTFIINMLVEHLLYMTSSYRIACTATTNKAVKVAYSMSELDETRLTYSTIHKLLGLKENINADGTISFVQDSFNPPSIENYKLLIVDEASMLDDTLFTGSDKMKGLYSYMEGGLRVIFVGDAYQIPPVNRAECLLFNATKRAKYGIEELTMTEIVRQAKDNPIISLATRIRERINDRAGATAKTELWEDDKGVHACRASSAEDMGKLAELLEHLFKSENFRSNPDFAKVIAWRKTRVKKFNRIIRRLIYEKDDLQRVEVGEKLIANEPIFEGDMIVMNNNEEMEVVEFKPDVEDVNEGQFLLPYLYTKVVFTNAEGKPEYRHLKILTEEGLEIHQHILEQIATAARQRTKGSALAAMAWREYFRFKRMFADVNYNYCLTAHKSQGSTYDNVIVLQSDIMANFKPSERNRILYTACTRPRHRLYLMN